MSRSRHLKLLFYKLLTTQLMSQIETITLNKLSSVILKIIFPGMYLGTQTLNKEALSCIITLHILYSINIQMEQPTRQRLQNSWPIKTCGSKQSRVVARVWGNGVYYLKNHVTHVHCSSCNRSTSKTAGFNHVTAIQADTNRKHNLLKAVGHKTTIPTRWRKQLWRTAASKKYK